MNYRLPPGRLSRLFIASIFLVFVCNLVGCADDNDSTGGTNADNSASDDKGPRTMRSESERYVVSWDGPDSPLPFQELFELTVEIRDAETDALLSGLDVKIRVRVVDTTADMPTRPEIEDLSNGQYKIRGLFFHIPDAWEFVVDIDDGESIDRARFEFETVGVYTGEVPADPTGRFSDEDLRHLLMMSPAEPPAPDPTNAVADDEDAAHLGQFLFFDERFSGDGTVACASCHAPDHGFSDPLTLSLGMGQTTRRSMPALNASYQRWFFWDGRADSQWSQALGPIESEVEHGITRTGLAHLLNDDEDLKAAYESVFSSLPDLNDTARFPDDARPVSDDTDHDDHQAWLAMSEDDRFAINEIFANFGKALAAYQRRLVRNDAPFDDFIAALRDGNQDGLDALSDEALQGLQLFVDKAQCVSCHGGQQFTNFEFHNLGLAPRSWMPDDVDAGRSEGLQTVAASQFSAHGPHSDAPDGEAAELLKYLPEPDFHSDGRFKTPGLRNVAERAPFMHGGHHGNLSENVDFYSDLQEDSVIGIRDPLLQQVNLSNSEINALVAFMESLTGAPISEELTSQPEAPSP